MTVKTGLRILLEKGLLRDKVIGLITNHTGCAEDLSRNLDLLIANGYRVGAVFSPEHGLDGEFQDGESIGHARDRRTGIPIYSLYGSSMTPKQEWLLGLDTLVFDIQDIGSRYYTYPATMLNSMEAAATAGVSFVILDRPNPLGGLIVEGNAPAPGHTSFVCPSPLPIRHGLTIGEYALFGADWRGLADPTIVKMDGWGRGMWFGDTGLPWVPPSPNAPTLSMAALYPGTCLVEGVNLSEGRGTPLPFEVVGAPWVDGDELAARLRDASMPGILWRPVRFRPATGKWCGQSCGGVQAHITSPSEMRPVEMGVRLLHTVKSMWPDELELVTPTEPSESAHYHLDLLAGGPGLREALWQENSPESVEALLDAWRIDAANFETLRKKYLIYR